MMEGPSWSSEGQPSPMDWLVRVAAVEEEADRCRLFADAFERLMQLMLAVSSLLVLYIKRQLESPMRPLKVWALDVCKQCCGALLIHVLSILFAVLFVAHADAGDDECGFYFVTYMLDTTWGIVLLLGVLNGLHALAQRWHCGGDDLSESGFYGDPPRLRAWAKQLAVYAVAIAIMKLVNGLLLLWWYAPLAHGATALFHSFSHHRHLELLLVMIVIPGCGNTFQFWIVDSYLKCDGAHWKYFTSPARSPRHGTEPSFDNRNRKASIGAKGTTPPVVGTIQPLLLTSVKRTTTSSSSTTEAHDEQ